MEHTDPIQESTPPASGATSDYGADKIKVLEGLEAVRLRPEDADIRTNLGALLASRGDLPGAVRWFEEALKLNPNDKVAREYLTRARSALAGKP